MSTLLAQKTLTADNTVKTTQSYVISSAQAAFEGAAEAMHISCEDDVQRLVDEVRYGNEWQLRQNGQH